VIETVGESKPTFCSLSPRSWNEELLQDVCAGLAEELHLAPDAPGGMVEFRRTLTLSFFFKFYLTVLQKLGRADLEGVSVEQSQAQSVFSTASGDSGG
jgi:xanthine dehydrogenase/oxidase